MGWVGSPNGAPRASQEVPPAQEGAFRSARLERGGVGSRVDGYKLMSILA